MSELTQAFTAASARRGRRRSLFEWLGLALFGLSTRLREWLWEMPRSRMYALTLQAPGMRVGSGFRCVGRPYMRIGQNLRGLDHLWLEVFFDGQGAPPSLEIGDHFTCSNAVHIAASQRVRIGSGVLIGSHVLITDHNHGSYRGERQSSPRTPPALRPISRGAEVFIGDNVWLGDQVVVLGGASIGEGSIIGSQTVVRGAVPVNSIAAGNPMRILRRYDEASEQWQGVAHD